MKTMLYPTWRKRISGFLLFVIWFIADIPFMMSYLPVATTGHDLIFHLYRIEGIAQGLIEGQFPVRMQTVQAAGYGYPVSIMYGDIFSIQWRYWLYWECPLIMRTSSTSWL